MKGTVVMKFGGTSVGDGERILGAGELVGRSLKAASACVVVASAMAGVTDLLIGAAEAAAHHELARAEAAAEVLRERHLATAETIGGKEKGKLEETIETLVSRFLTLCRAIDALGELTPRTMDAVASLGERLSAPLVAAAVRRAGLRARALDASSLIVTDERFGAASPLMEPTRERCRAVLVPLLAEGVVPVVTGFIGATREGITTTLGRGGSDYSAAILGAAIEAEAIWIWTDVPGVMTADPRVIPEATTVPVLSYAEAVELAHLGAKVIYPKTALPAEEAGIPIRIRCTFRPEGPGTLIRSRPEGAPTTVRAVVCRKGLSLLRLAGKGGPGTAARAFATAAEVGAEAILGTHSTSEQNICLLLCRKDSERVRIALTQAFAAELGRGEINEIEVWDDLAVVAPVGEGIASEPRIAAEALLALGERDVEILSILHGASPHSLPLVIPESAADDAVRILHRHFRLGEPVGTGSRR